MESARQPDDGYRMQERGDSRPQVGCGGLRAESNPYLQECSVHSRQRHLSRYSQNFEVRSIHHRSIRVDETPEGTSSNAMTVHRRIEKQRLPPLRSAVPLWLCGGIEVNCCHSAVIMLSFRVQVVATVALRFCSICTIFVTVLLYRNAQNLYALCMRFVCILTFHLAAFAFFVSAFVG